MSASPVLPYDGSLCHDMQALSLPSSSSPRSSRASTPSPGSTSSIDSSVGSSGGGSNPVYTTSQKSIREVHNAALLAIGYVREIIIEKDRVTDKNRKLVAEKLESLTKYLEEQVALVNLVVAPRSISPLSSSLSRTQEDHRSTNTKKAQILTKNIRALVNEILQIVQHDKIDLTPEDREEITKSLKELNTPIDQLALFITHSTPPESPKNRTRAMSSSKKRSNDSLSGPDNLEAQITTPETLKDWVKAYLSVPQYELSQWSLAQLSNSLATVYQATKTEGKTTRSIIVKQWNMTTRDLADDIRQTLMRELRVFKKLRQHPSHDHIVALLGYAIDEAPEGWKFSLVLEYCPLKSVATLVINHELTDDKEIYRIAHEACIPIRFLHGLGIIYRDIRSDNYVVSTKGSTIKLIDFGHSGPESEGIIPGALNWCAPEVLEPPLEEKEKSSTISREQGTPADVYSFGKFLYELIAQKEPHKHPRHLLTENEIRNGIFPQFTDEQRRRFPELIAIAHSCWNMKPELRPTIDELETRLRTLCW